MLNPAQSMDDKIKIIKVTLPSQATTTQAVSYANLDIDGYAVVSVTVHRSSDGTELGYNRLIWDEFYFYSLGTTLFVRMTNATTNTMGQDAYFLYVKKVS